MPQPLAIRSGAIDTGGDLTEPADRYGPLVSEDLVREVRHPHEGLAIPPIPGTGRVDPLAENVAASALRLGDDDVGALHDAEAAAWDEANGR
jgi:hypothetical protein